MLVFEKLEPILSPTRPCVLTIGSFDGVHKGHQMLLKKVKELGQEGTTAVLTFSNHPTYVLEHLQPVPMILSKSLKINELNNEEVNVVYCLEFTKEVAALSYEAFLKRVREAFPFDHLVLGEGATLGNKREGNSVRIKALSEAMGFEVHYLMKLGTGEKEISSGRIRTCIMNGDLQSAQEMLGHPFELEATKVQGEWQVPFSQCLPPDGIYHVSVDEMPCELIIKNRVLTLSDERLAQKVLITFE